MSNEPIINNPAQEVAPIETTTQDAPKWLVYTLTTLAYGIPLAFLAYVLYVNYLPFGYNKTFTIDVGTEGDTDASQSFYLEPSPDLSERKTAPDGTTYRELNGMANVVFKPNVVLKDAEITVSVEGEGVEIIPPVIDFDPNSISWDYNWDFTQGKTPEELGLKGNAYPFDGAMYFDGTARLELPDSADKFEDGPFTVYAEWTPTNNGDDFQQIVGHFNWEIFQEKNQIRFFVGRMNNEIGPSYSIEFPIEKDFFNKKHHLLAIYKPSQDGFIELYVDNEFAGRTYFGSDRIWDRYNEKRDLSFGNTRHGSGNRFFKGNTERVSIKMNSVIENTSTANFKIKKTSLEEDLYFTFISKSADAKVDLVSLIVNR